MSSHQQLFFVGGMALPGAAHGGGKDQSSMALGKALTGYPGLPPPPGTPGKGGSGKGAKRAAGEEEDDDDEYVPEDEEDEDEDGDEDDDDDSSDANNQLPEGGPDFVVGPNGLRRRRKRLTKKWSQEEDAVLAQLVAIHGQRDWGLIARHMPGRHRKGKQCRERWRNQVSLCFVRACRDGLGRMAWGLWGAPFRSTD